MNDSRIVPYNEEYRQLAKKFHCGNIHIDTFLRSTDSLNENICKTYIYLNDDSSEIIGFYSISTGCVEQNDSGLILKMGGSIHITDFALDENYHGWEMNDGDIKINLSDILLIDCLDRIKNLQKQVGFSFVTLNATEQGYPLYSRNDFERIEEDMRIPKDKKESDCIPMYLSLELL